MVRLLPAVALCAALTAQSLPVYDTPDLKGKLYKTVFRPGVGTLSAADVKPLPAAVGARLQRFLDRRATFASRLQGNASSMDDVAIEAKKRRVEGAIVALIEAPGIEQAAADYAQQTFIANEWKDAGQPAKEANAAEEFLKKDPATPLAPFIYVFIADRQRAAFEAMNVGTDKEQMTAAAKKYRTFLQRARSSGDSIFTLLADDMDRQPFLHRKTEFHPRDFDPDS